MNHAQTLYAQERGRGRLDKNRVAEVDSPKTWGRIGWGRIPRGRTGNGEITGDALMEVV